MGEPNNALKVYMNRPDRIRSVLEYYLGENCLEPVLNLMLYWGRKRWNGPLSLRGMMGNVDALPVRIRHLLGEYRVHIVSMRFIAEEDLQKMDSDLKYVLGIMKHTASPKQYERFIWENREYFSRIPRSAVDVIDACSNIKDIKKCLQYTLNPESGEEETDMCKALKQIKKREMKKGIRQGVRQGERQGILMTLFSLVNDGLLQMGEAARRADLSEAAFYSEMRKAGYR